MNPADAFGSQDVPAFDASVAGLESDAGSNAVQRILASPRLEIVRRPIPGDEPCGLDVTYDEGFQRIKMEIDRIGRVSTAVDQERATADARQLKGTTRREKRRRDKKRGESDESEGRSIVSDRAGVDYPLIIDLAIGILEKKSKDMRVAGYLCLALSRSRGFPGLLEGLAVFSTLLREFWEGLFPAKGRLEARKSVVAFLAGRLAEGLEGTPVAAEDRELLEAAGSILADLKEDLETWLPEDPPSLLSVAKAVDECLGRVPAITGKEEPRERRLDTEADRRGPGPETRTADSEPESPKDAYASIRRASFFLRTRDRGSAMPYRLMRSMRWDVLTAEPPCEDGKTKIEAPVVQRREHLNKLFEESRWDTLLEECEISFGQPSFHLWLDLQRFVVAASDSLDGFQAVRTAVLEELSVLLRRLPGIVSMAFRDGTPFADVATRAWIEETVVPLPGDDPSSPLGADEGTTETELARLFEEAKSALGSTGLGGALAVLQNGDSKDSSRKSRFQRRLFMALMCMRGNQPNMARPLLEILDKEVRKYSIDEWEPSLALQVWTNLHRCYRLLDAGASTPGDRTFQDGISVVFDRICRLNVRYALSIAHDEGGGRF